MSAIELLARRRNCDPQLLVEDAVEPVDLVAVAVDGVGNFIHRVIAEVIVLAGHRAEIAHLPEQPLDRVGARAQILCQKRPVLLGKIEQDSPRTFENCNRLASAGRCVIDDGGNSVVGEMARNWRLNCSPLRYFTGMML